MKKKESKVRLAYIVAKYADERRTELTNIEMPKEEKEIAEVVPEDVVVVMTQTGLIKKVPMSTFRVQRKGGKGIKTHDDAILEVIKTNTIDTLMLFSTKGKMYRIVVDNIPDSTNASKGTPIDNLIELEKDENIAAVTSLHRKTNAKFVVFITKNGMFKKTYLEEYMKTKRNTGIAAINLKEDDSVVNITFLEDEEIIYITKNGMSIRFETKDIAPVGRVTMGVKGIKLNEGDEVIKALPIHKKTDTIAVFTETGLGKKTKLEEFPIQGRGGKGTYIYKPTPESGSLVGAEMLSDEDKLLLIGNYSTICISATDVPIIGKAGLGNKMIKNNRIMSVVKL